MLFFGSLSLALVSARDHLVFLTAQVTRDGEVFDYKENAYDELANSLKEFEIEATSTRQVNLPSPDWKLTVFQEIERSIADLESRDDYGPADTYFACHGLSCSYLSNVLADGLWDDKRKGIIFMGSEPSVFDSEGRPKPQEFLTDMRKISLIGQFDGVFTVSHAARLEPLVALSNTYFALIPGARHSSFGTELDFKMDDIDVNSDFADIQSQFVNFIQSNTEQLTQSDEEARNYWAPLGGALRFEREYENTDENWLFPNDDCLNTPLNEYIQNDILGKQLEGSGIAYQNKHEWRLPYKDENSDIGSPKPRVEFNGTHVFTDSYTHDYFLPHFQFEGRNEVTATLTNSSSVDIQMKFKNQKWIAREVGIENWEGVEKDNCDTYQNQFYAQSFEMLENSVYGSSILEKYESDACQIGVEEAVTTVGIFWLETPVHYTFKRDGGRKKMMVRANNMYTDETNTSESELDRLGGMLYCRLVGPARFLEWIMIDGLRSSNTRQC